MNNLINKTYLNKDNKYILAVSGGVDSVVLLDLLVGINLDLVVAHLDHGIRKDSPADARFVEALAGEYKLQFEHTRVNLGIATSEDVARQARYEFLREAKEKHQAQAIITAHHRDDVIETAILNLKRGTYRKGLSSLDSSEHLIRPMLDTSKAEIYEYALKNNLEWVEDSTNYDQDYRRNYIRKTVLPFIKSKDPSFEDKFIEHVDKSKELNQKIDNLEAELFPQLIKDDKINRLDVITLPSVVSKELIAYILRRFDQELDSQSITNLWLFIKTAQAGRTYQFSKSLNVSTEDSKVIFTEV